MSVSISVLKQVYDHIQNEFKRLNITNLHIHKTYDGIKIFDFYQMSFETFSKFLLQKDKIYLKRLIDSISRIYPSFNDQIVFDIIDDHNDILFYIDRIIYKRDNLTMRKNELENELNTIKETLNSIDKMLDIQKDLTERVEELKIKLDIQI